MLAVERRKQLPMKATVAESMPTRYLPYARHLRDDVIVLDSNSLMVMFELEGRPFETSDTRELNDWHEKLNGVWRNLHDERLSVWTHLIRSRVRDYPGGEFTSSFARKLNGDYAARISDQVMYVNRFFVSLVIRQDMLADRFANLFRKKVGKNEMKASENDALELLDDKASDLMKLLKRVSPRRLATYEFRGLTFSEPLEVMNAVMTSRYDRVPVVRGHLSGGLYASRVIFGSETVEIRGAAESLYGGIFGIREYPSRTVSRQLESLLSANFGFVLTQSFTFLGRADATERFRKRQAQMANAEDRAISQADELTDAADDLQSSRFVLGDHHFSLAVYSPAMRELRDHLSIARAALADTGMVSSRESAALEAAYWGQLVGNFSWRARPAPITSRNFASLSPFHTFPAGQASDNHWGEAVALLKTSARSPYYFNFHKGDLGHTLIVGPSGGGKTVLLNFLMAQLEKTGCRQIFIDKDQGGEIFVRAVGGTYLALANGTATGFNPLKALSDNPDDRAFLSRFVRSLVAVEGKAFSVQEDRQIEAGIAAVMALPPEARSFAALRTQLGMQDSEGVGARLERWTSGGSLGWVFDNETDELAMDARFMGFDMTDFLDNADIRTPIMLYLFHRIDKLLTGDRVVISIDEFWKALGDPAFMAFAHDGLKTYRKRNAFFVFATQSPADALRSPISHSILEQVATKIFLPNAFGSAKDYRDGFGLSAAEYQLVRVELSPESHKFLIKQAHDSVVVELDLGDMDDALAVLSGRAETTSVARAAISEVGDNPAAWLPIFHQRRRAS